MRRFPLWPALIAFAIAGVGIGFWAYNWGYTRGLEHAGANVQIVRDGGFPFGFVFFPLFFLFLFGLRWARWGRWGHHHWRTDRFDDWHRGQHEELPKS